LPFSYYLTLRSAVYEHYERVAVRRKRLVGLGPVIYLPLSSIHGTMLRLVGHLDSIAKVLERTREEGGGTYAIWMDFEGTFTEGGVDFWKGGGG
jgi:hypothetical protein